MLVFPKRTMLGICDTCTDLRSRKIHSRSLYELQQLKTAMRKHTAEVRQQRIDFYARRTASAAHPLMQMSILSDSTSRYLFHIVQFFYPILTILSDYQFLTQLHFLKAGQH